MTTRALSAIFALSATTLCTSQAVAQTQPWLGDRRFGGGIGVRAGNFELHPGIAGEVGYDTNYFQSAGKVTPEGSVVLIPPESRPVAADGTSFGEQGVFREPRVGTYRFRVTPSLTLTTLGPQRSNEDAAEEAAPPLLNLSASLAASYNELIAADSQYSEAVDDEETLTADLGVALDILPNRPWGVGLTAGYNRSVQPVNDPEAPPRFARSTFRGGSALRWRPGGGVLEWSLGYDLTYVAFEDVAFDAFSSVSHAIALKGRWLFLPRTALLYAGDYGFLDYPNGGQLKPQGSPLSSRLGISGLVTNHLAALAMVGWKSLFFDQGGEFDSLVANAELTWYPLPRPDLAPEAATVGLSAISLGYRRDAKPAYLGNYVQVDGGYVRASYFFGGTVLFSADAAFDHLRRPASFSNTLVQQSSAFSENRVNATGFLEYRTSDTFGINTTVRYSAALTDQRIIVDTDPVAGSPGNPAYGYDDLGFDRIEAWLGVRWFL